MLLYCIGRKQLLTKAEKAQSPNNNWEIKNTLKLKGQSNCDLVRARSKHCLKIRVLGFGLKIMYSVIWVLLENSRFQ
ncbi:hypothetical protein L3X38_043981 [Prunus dulcis]|uniref:Uncharacterized protein n=1 Tax=Prunus dulcis TaxID=3755 RepID=A0AAD4UXK2_PRUDU|nr:hypothetical protein L3X38_043981 [Prunus dulcis]